MIPELRDLCHKERLREYDLTIIDTRRLRGDQKKDFKTLNGHEDIDRNILLRKTVELDDSMEY